MNKISHQKARFAAKFQLTLLTNTETLIGGGYITIKDVFI
jgi:hypothetical protein